jgi:[acyl-carrier-protein] S-malonyltransferase
MKRPMIFPGQASQFVGMGADLYESVPAAREKIEAAEARLGFELKRLCFEGPIEELTETRYAQPSILLMSCLTFDWLSKKGVEATVTAGHSLGEYSALVAAGVLSFEDALDLVALRGRLMFKSGVKTPGTMAAVMGLAREPVENCCAEASQGEVVQLANLNSPEQMVISGAVPAVERAMKACEEAGAKKVVRLNVSGAFHSELMGSAATELGEKLSATHFAEAKVPVVPNVTAEATRDGGNLRGLLIQQLTKPVLWTDSMATLRAVDDSPIMEVGPGKVLMGLMRRIDRGAKVNPVGTLASLEAWTSAEEGKEAGA